MSRPEPSGTGRIGWRCWAGLALPPIAWWLHHQFGSDLNYADCAVSRVPALTAGGICLALLACGAALSLRVWRQAGGGPETKQEPVGRFLSGLGLMLAGLLGLTLVLQIIAVIALPPCFR